MVIEDLVGGGAGVLRQARGVGVEQLALVQTLAELGVHVGHHYKQQCLHVGKCCTLNKLLQKLTVWAT